MGRNAHNPPTRHEQPERRGRPAAPSLGRWLWGWTKSISVAILLFLVIRTFVVEAFSISSGSMERTLLAGDFLLVNKAAYGAQVPFTVIWLPAIDTIERRDVVILDPPIESTAPYVKRVVGLPGDRVAMRGGVLYVNRERQEETYVVHIPALDDYSDRQFDWQSGHLAAEIDRAGYRPTRDNWGPIVVPDGEYFVMGDNRDNSQDSRHWGFVKRNRVKGRPFLIYYSYDRERLRPLPWLTEIRWNRLGSLVR